MVGVIEHIHITRLHLAGVLAITVLMLSPMEPRCTGMCGALAIRLLRVEQRAAEVQPLLM